MSKRWVVNAIRLGFAFIFYKTQSAEFGKHTPKKFPTKFPCTPGDWRESCEVPPWLTLSKKYLTIWSPRMPEMVFTAPHGSRLHNVVPRPHGTLTCSKLFAFGRKITFIFVNKFCTHYSGLTKSAHLHTCDFCKISLHTCTPEILSCTPEISLKTAILCSLV